MSVVDSPSVSRSPHDNVNTRADNELPISEGTDRSVAEWQALIYHTLIEWGRAPDECSDEGMEPPCARVVKKAIDFAEAMQRDGQSAPSRVVPDADGGIVFEHRSETGLEILHIWDDESVEYYRLEDGRVVERRAIQI